MCVYVVLCADKSFGPKSSYEKHEPVACGLQMEIWWLGGNDGALIEIMCFFKWFIQIGIMFTVYVSILFILWGGSERQNIIQSTNCEHKSRSLGGSRLHSRRLHFYLYKNMFYWTECIRKKKQLSCNYYYASKWSEQRKQLVREKLPSSFLIFLYVSNQ